MLSDALGMSLCLGWPAVKIRVFMLQETVRVLQLISIW
jgi:hypothetical protein